jgi:hypothetical protein
VAGVVLVAVDLGRVRVYLGRLELVGLNLCGFEMLLKEVGEEMEQFL